MTAFQSMSIEIEARRLIARARKISRRAERARTPHLCLMCRLHLCAIPVWAVRGACVIALAVDLYGLHKLGVI
jgi:hypothetical protein